MNVRDGWISPLTNALEPGQDVCLSVAWFQLMRARHSSSWLKHSSQLFLCYVNPPCLRRSSSPNSSNHVKQNSNHDPWRLPRVCTVVGSCCRQRFLAHAVHASSHTPGSWCPALLWVSDGTGLITLLRLVSSAW